MDSILDVLHRCAEEYKANEKKRVMELKEGAKTRKVVSKPKKKRTKKKDAAPKKKIDPKSIEELLVKKPVDKCLEHAKEYLDGKRTLYEKADLIPTWERAECYTPWCMHFVNGHCIHRECIVYNDKQRKYETN